MRWPNTTVLAMPTSRTETRPTSSACDIEQASNVETVQPDSVLEDLLGLEASGFQVAWPRIPLYR